jgi:hypothetical protein
MNKINKTIRMATSLSLSLSFGIFSSGFLFNNHTYINHASGLRLLSTAARLTFFLKQVVYSPSLVMHLTLLHQHSTISERKKIFSKYPKKLIAKN